MSEIIITLRLNKSEREIINKLAKQSCLGVSGYIRKKVFEDNVDLCQDEPRYYCPQGDKLNYLQTGLAMLNQELLLSLLKKQYGFEAGEIFDRCFDISVKKLEKNYGYRKLEDNTDE